MIEAKPEQSVTLLILVVDDEPDVEVLFRQHFRRDLREGRFTMEFAQSGDSALQRIRDAGTGYNPDRFPDKVFGRDKFFKNGNYPGSALITVTNFARPGIEIEIQAVGVIGDTCSNDNPCSAQGKAKKAQNK